jgi:excisionase family DNA binding protein
VPKEPTRATKTTKAIRPYRIGELAERLGCSDDHVRNLIARNIIPAVFVPGIGRRIGRVIVLPEDFDACVRQWKERP